MTFEILEAEVEETAEAIDAEGELRARSRGDNVYAIQT
jgi:hypothetical protein